MIKNKFFWPLMNNNIIKSDLEVLINYLKQDDPQLTHGRKVIEFETKWSEWLGTKFSTMVNSGSSANDLTMLAIRELLGPGEIIVPPLTWVSDIASVFHAGHTPVFVDINPNTLAMDTDKVLDSITKNTKAVFLTHILGFNGLTNKLIDNLNKLNIILIEDVCESHGATHNGKKVGSYGLASNFSFYYAHHLTTIEGGMISSQDKEFNRLVRMIRSHGLVRESNDEDFKSKVIKSNPDLNKEFIFKYIGHNMRPTELNGVLGLSQITRLDKNIEKRNQNFKKFIENIDKNIYKTDFNMEGISNYALTLVLKEPNYDLRNKVEKILNENKIEFRRGLSGGGNQLRQPYINERLGHVNLNNFPEVEHIHHFSWYIGNYPELEESKISYLVDILNSGV